MLVIRHRDGTWEFWDVLVMGRGAGTWFKGVVVLRCGSVVVLGCKSAQMLQCGGTKNIQVKTVVLWSSRSNSRDSCLVLVSSLWCENVLSKWYLLGVRDL